MVSKKILIVDDDPAIIDSLQLMLELADYEVTTSADGKIMPLVDKNNPDLLLLDIWLSGIDGRDICKKIKADAKTRSIPVILISANRDIEKSSKEAGADDFLEKPFDMEVLLEKVSTYVK